MNLLYHPDGSLEVRPPLSKPKDYIEFCAEMDLMIGISNCPQDRTPVNAFNPSSSKVIIYNPDDPQKKIIGKLQGVTMNRHEKSIELFGESCHTLQEVLRVTLDLSLN